MRHHFSKELWRGEYRDDCTLKTFSVYLQNGVT